MTLKVYENDVTEWVIAESPEDATRIIEEQMGFAHDDPPEWAECDLDRVWTLEEGPTGVPISKTFREWIASEGRGFLGTTEY